MIQLHIRYRTTTSGELIGCVLEVPGAASQAKSLESLKENLKKAAISIMSSPGNTENNFEEAAEKWKGHWASPENAHDTIDVSIPILCLIIDEYKRSVFQILPLPMEHQKPELRDGHSLVILTNDDVTNIATAFHQAAINAPYELKGKPIFPKA